ncbi:hypothetical protein C4579_03605 [Candidatus Microgenomates bacterium]|nr:MAG: hypothetical protein C4579_03605 [Candidatus Microgenomates bacterium]
MKAIWDLKSNFQKHHNQSVFDCYLAEYVLSGGDHELTQQKTFAVHEVTDLESLAKKQQELFAKYPKLHDLYLHIEFPLVAILCAMEKNGILVDRKQMDALAKTVADEITQLTKDLHHALGDVNPASPAQVGKALFDDLNVPLKKTRSGQYATGEIELLPLSKEFPIIKKILAFRQLSKLTNTYIVPLVEKIGKDGRIHTTYNQTVAATGRLSAHHPNMQSIPSNTDSGRRIKKCFVPTHGFVFAAFDYSQQELRILAHQTKEAALIAAFKSGKDIHRATAAEIFHTSYEKVTSEQRNAAKTINFGMLYGMGDYGLARTLNIAPEEAGVFISAFYQTYPRVKSFFDELLKTARKQRYVETILGRRKVVHLDSKGQIDSGQKREIINFPMQGSAADLMKKAMVDVDAQVLQTNKDVRLILQIHDELLFEIKDDRHTQQVCEQIKKVMEDTYKMDVPVEVEIKTGGSWGELE